MLREPQTCTTSYHSSNVKTRDAFPPSLPSTDILKPEPPFLEGALLQALSSFHIIFTSFSWLSSGAADAGTPKTAQQKLQTPLLSVSNCQAPFCLLLLRVEAHVYVLVPCSTAYTKTFYGCLTGRGVAAITSPHGVEDRP